MNLQRNVQQALPLLILILLVGLTMWLERATRVDDRPSSGKLRHDPDVIVDNFTVRRFDPSGQVRLFVRYGMPVDDLVSDIRQLL